MADPISPLVVIAGGEAIAALLLTIGVAVTAARSDAGLVAGVATLVMWAVAVACVGLIWLGLHGRRAAARTPFLLVQAFALVVAWPLLHSDAALGVIAGVLLAVAAIGGLVAGMRPAVRESLR